MGFGLRPCHPKPRLPEPHGAFDDLPWEVWRFPQGCSDVCQGNSTDVFVCTFEEACDELIIELELSPEQKRDEVLSEPLLRAAWMVVGRCGWCLKPLDRLPVLVSQKLKRGVVGRAEHDIRLPSGITQMIELGVLRENVAKPLLHPLLVQQH